MERELSQSFQQLTMYSKMGRYISNKILKFNRSSQPYRQTRKSLPNVEDYLRRKADRSKDKSESA